MCVIILFTLALCTEMTCMLCDVLIDRHAHTRENTGKHMQAKATTMATHVNMCWHAATHTCTVLPCVSVDWVNQPNFPFFFSVRSARVTPWRYQHAVHTARQQRQQWVNTKQRGGEKESRKVRQEKAAVQTTVQTQLLHPGRLPKQKSSAKPEPGLCFPRIIQ